MSFNDKHYEFVELGQRFANTVFAEGELNPDTLELLFGEDTPEAYQKLIEAQMDDPGRELALAAAELFLAWIVASSFVCSNPYLCSPTGKVVAIASDFLGHDLEIGLVNWKSVPIPLEFRKLCLDFAFTQNPYAVWEGFGTFHYPSGIVRTVGPQEEPSVDFDHKHILSKQFEGWAICFKVGEIPEDGNKALEELGFDPSGLWREEEETEGERLDRLGFVWKCMLERYPQGKNGSWAEVERKIGFSRRTMERAMSANQSSWWRSAVGK